MCLIEIQVSQRKSRFSCQSAARSAFALGVTNDLTELQAKGVLGAKPPPGGAVTKRNGDHMQGDQINLSDSKLTTLKLHFFYIVLILSGCLIAVATGEWTKLDGFTEYLSVSATLTSLVLGVLAIIYGFISSNSTNNFLGSVEASAREMKDVGTALQTVLSKGQDLQTKAQDRNEELHALIGNLRDTIEALSASTTNIAGAVETIPLKIESLRAELANKATTPNTASPLQPVAQTLQSDQVKQFLAASSPMGLSALRSLQQAKYRTRPCDLGFIFKDKYFDSFDYVHGYLVASSCLGIVEFELENKSRTATTILFPKNVDVEELIDREWEGRASGSEESVKQSIKKYADLIEASFAQPVTATVSAASTPGGEG